MEQILISMDNIQKILEGFINDLKNKINNKDLSTPYIEQFTKAGLIKTDGLGDMFLCNNGQYIKIDLNNIEDVNNKIQTIYDLFKIEKYNTKWTTGPNTPTPKYESTSQIYNDKIYCIGGSTSEGVSNKVEIYDIKNDTWTNGKNMSMNISQLTSQIYQNKIYCIGGYNNKSLNNVEIYDIESDTWSNGLIMPTSRYGTTSQIYKGTIHVIGGYNYDTPYLSIYEMYDVESNTWSNGKSMSTRRYLLSSCIYENKIYCIGGHNNYGSLNTTEIYNIDNGTWSTELPMPDKKYGHISQIYNNKIYCIGGIDLIVYVYDIKNKIWSTEISIPNKRYQLTSCMYENKIYCIGGLNISGIDILNLPYSNYDIKLPEELDNKLNIIKSDGLGNKLLADNGTYIDPSNNYTSMTTEQVNAMINSLGV